MNARIGWKTMVTEFVPGTVDRDIINRGYMSDCVYRVRVGLIRFERYVVLQKRRSSWRPEPTVIAVERRTFILNRKHRKQPPELWKNTWSSYNAAREAIFQYERNRYGNRKIIRLWNLLRRG